jgi:hypothetical protein
MGVEEGDEIQIKGINNLLNRMIAENFPNLDKNRVTHVPQAYSAPNCQDQKRNTSRHIIIKTLRTQNKERVLNATKEKRQATYKGKPIRNNSRFFNSN